MSTHHAHHTTRTIREILGLDVDHKGKTTLKKVKEELPVNPLKDGDVHSRVYDSYKKAFKERKKVDKVFSAFLEAEDSDKAFTSLTPNMQKVVLGEHVEPSRLLKDGEIMKCDYMERISHIVAKELQVKEKSLGYTTYVGGGSTPCSQGKKCPYSFSFNELFPEDSFNRGDDIKYCSKELTAPMEAYHHLKRKIADQEVDTPREQRRKKYMKHFIS